MAVFVNFSVIFGYWLKSAFFGHFSVILPKSALFCQIECPQMPENDPILAPSKPNKIALDRKLVRFLTRKVVKNDDFSVIFCKFTRPRPKRMARMS